MKRKITIDRPKIDSQEIASRQDFTNIVSQLPKGIKPPFYKSGWFITTIASVAGIAIITSAILANNNNPEKTDSIVSSQSPPPEENENQINSVYSYEEDSPCINPPSKDFDLAFEEYQVDNNQGGKVTTKDGVEITIPKNSFVDTLGNQIKGKVTLQFRLINNSIDIMLSGIPMHYDSSGQKMVLLSDGMIEINGFYDNGSIQIAPDKSLAVKLNSSDESTRYNSYYLNQEEDQWKFTGKPDVQIDLAETPEVEPEIVHDFTYDFVQLEQEVNSAKTILANASKSVQDYMKLEPQKPVSEGNKDRQFVLDVNKNEFPELSAYQNLVFEVESTDPNFTPSVYEEQWEDVSLSEKEKGKKYYLTLFKKGAKKTFSVFPVFSGSDLETALTNFNKSFSTYSKELASRKTAESKAKEVYEGKLAKWEKAKEEELKQMNAIQAEQSNNSNLKKISKILNVATFGVWNIDCGIEPPKGVKREVIFHDQYGNELDISSVNLFEKGKNTIYTYRKDQFNTFEYNPQESNYLIAFLGDEKVGIAYNDQFSNNNDKKKIFKLEIKPLTDKLISQLKEM